MSLFKLKTGHSFCLLQVLSFAALEREKGPREIEFVDIYHSATRYNTGPAAHIPIALPSSVIFSFSRNRIIIGVLSSLFSIWYQELTARFCCLIFNSEFTSHDEPALRTRTLEVSGL